MSAYYDLSDVGDLSQFEFCVTHQRPEDPERTEAIFLWASSKCYVCVGTAPAHMAPEVERELDSLIRAARNLVGKP